MVIKEICSSCVVFELRYEECGLLAEMLEDADLGCDRETESQHLHTMWSLLKVAEHFSSSMLDAANFTSVKFLTAYEKSKSQEGSDG